MNPEALLINRPAIDFRTFLGIGRKVMGYSLGEASNSAHREVPDAERFLSCLAALRDQKAPVSLPPKLLTHVSFSVLLVADDRDMPDILECCAGMPFTLADTLARGVQIAVVSGALGQWRDAVASGMTPGEEASVRHCFNKIRKLFRAEGLDVWTDFNLREAPDHVTYYLEDKRKR